MITLAMIARDEATRLGPCLASAAGAVDEVVLVDTGSRDGTREVARAGGARVIDWAWRDDFAAARNESLRHAAGDWVLILDADERLVPGSAALIRQLAARGAADGYDCRLVSALPADEPVTGIAHWYCRLFRPGPGVQFAGRIHEQVAPSILAAGGRIVRSDVTILHEGYAEASVVKIARNLRLLEQAVVERPDDAFTLLNLGITLAQSGRRDDAVDALERAVASRVGGLAGDLAAVAWVRLAQMRLAAGAFSAAAAAAERALAHQPDLVLARYVLGRALFEQGRLAAAARLFDELAGAPADALGMTLHPHLVAIAQGVVRLRQRRWADAVAALEPVAGDDPGGEAAYHLGNAHLGLAQLPQAAAAYRAARARGFTDPHLERRLELTSRLAGAAMAGTGR